MPRGFSSGLFKGPIRPEEDPNALAQIILGYKNSQENARVNDAQIGQMRAHTQLLNQDFQQRQATMAEYNAPDAVATRELLKKNAVITSNQNVQQNAQKLQGGEIDLKKGVIELTTLQQEQGAIPTWFRNIDKTMAVARNGAQLAQVQSLTNQTNLNTQLKQAEAKRQAELNDPTTPLGQQAAQQHFLQAHAGAGPDQVYLAHANPEVIQSLAAAYKVSPEFVKAHVNAAKSMLDDQRRQQMDVLQQRTQMSRLEESMSLAWQAGKPETALAAARLIAQSSPAIIARLRDAPPEQHDSIIQVAAQDVMAAYGLDPKAKPAAKPAAPAGAPQPDLRMGGGPTTSGGKVPPPPAAPAPAAQPAAAPAASKGPLPLEVAKQYLQTAGGDKNLARQLAARDGWTVQ